MGKEFSLLKISWKTYEMVDGHLSFYPRRDRLSGRSEKIPAAFPARARGALRRQAGPSNPDGPLLLSPQHGAPASGVAHRGHRIVAGQPPGSARGHAGRVLAVVRPVQDVRSG